MTRLTAAEARHLIARASNVPLVADHLHADRMADGERLFVMGEPDDDVLRARTELVVPVVET